RADQSRRDIVRAQLSIAEMGREREAAVDDRNRFGGAKRSARRFQFGLAVLCLALAQFAKDGHDAANLAERGWFGGQFQRSPKGFDTTPDDLDLFVSGFGHG